MEGLEAHARAVSVRLSALDAECRCMNDVLRLARPDILELQPYQHAAWNPTLERLHANEMPWRATGDVSDAGLNRYPEPQPRALLERLARLYDVPASRILAGRGSDEAIDLLVRAFCRAGQDQVVVCPPTFGYYSVAARIQGAAVREVPLRAGDFGLDACGGYRGGTGRQAGVSLLAEQPHGPAARRRRRSSSFAACSRRKRSSWWTRRTSSSPRVPSLASRLAEFPNLVVLRTLSKAYALAGARCGALLASEAIVGLLRRILPPYALPASSVEAVLRLTAEPQRRQAQARIDTLRGERERMRARLAALPGVRRVLPSDANFLLAEFAAPQAALAAGCAAGLLFGT